MLQIADKYQSEKIVFNMKEYLKQRCVNEFQYGYKISPTDSQCLLNIYGDQTVDVNTVMQGDSNSKRQPCTDVNVIIGQNT